MAKEKSTPPPSPGPDKKTVKKIADIEKQLKSIQTIKPPDLTETVDQASKYLKNLQAVKATQTELNDLAQAANDVALKGFDAQAKALALGKKLTKEERLEFVMQSKTLRVQQDQTKNLQEELKLRGNIYKTGAKLSKELKSREESQKKLNKLEDKYKGSVEEGLGFIDDINDKIKSIPIVGDFLSKAIGLDKIKEELTNKFTGYIASALDPAAAKQKQASDAALAGYDEQVKALNGISDASGGVTGGMEGVADAAGGIGGGLKSSIPGALGLNAAMGPLLLVALAIGAAVALFKEALEVDQEVTDMAKGLGTSRHEAEHTHHELIDIASTTKVAGANAKALGESYMELAKSMGVSQIANKEMAETQVYLKNQIGMSADEASSFQKMSMAGGKSAEQNLAVIQAGVEGMTGGLMNYKDVAKDIGTSSKAVQASYKGNIAALTKAVVTAKKFGMTLDQTKKSADSILDVESSLEAEMKANVLTGKNMNLNAARELALKGDTAGAMEEMMAQAGGYDELMEMAPYQQKAVAEAMGMTVDEMISAAEHQKNLNTMADELGITLDKNGKMSEEQMAIAMNSNNEEAKKLALQQQQASAQEKMSAMGDKLSAVFMKMAEPIMDILGPLMELIDFVFPAISAAISIAFAPFKLVFSIVGGLVEGLMKMYKIVGKVGELINTALGDPIGKISNFVSDIGEGISNFFGGIFDSVKNGIKNLLPDWAIAIIFDDDADEDKKKKREKELTGKESTTEVHDAHIGSDGGLLVSGGKGTYQLDENDSVIAGTNLEGTSNGGSSAAAPASSNSEVVALLKELIKKVDQPVNINIGGRVVQEIDRMITMNKTYNTKGDNTYGAT